MRTRRELRSVQLHAKLQASCPLRRGPGLRMVHQARAPPGRELVPPRSVLAADYQVKALQLRPLRAPPVRGAPKYRDLARVPWARSTRATGPDKQVGR